MMGAWTVVVDGLVYKATVLSLLDIVCIQSDKRAAAVSRRSACVEGVCMA